MGRIALDKTTVLNDIKRVMIRLNNDNPTQTQYLENNGAVSHVTIMRLFGSFKNAVKAVHADKTITGSAPEILIARDVRRVSRKLDGKTPTRDDYVKLGKFGKNTIAKTYGSWSEAVKTVM